MHDRFALARPLIALACVAAIGAYLIFGVKGPSTVAVTVRDAPIAAPRMAALKSPPPLQVVLPDKRNLRLLFVGDSLRAGYFATTPAQSYVARVTAAVKRKHPGAVALDATKIVATGDGFRRARSIKQVPSDFDLAVVEIGTNDAGDHDVGRFGRDYARLLAMIHRVSPRAKLLCVSTWQGGAPINQLYQSYSAAVSEACVRGVYVDISDIALQSAYHGPAGRKVKTSTQVSDVFHPNDAGHRAIADAILEHLRF